METMVSEDLGFGSMEACQAGIGIPCVGCKYAKDCIGEPEPDITKSYVGICGNCGNEYDVDVREGDEPILVDTCGNCGCEFEWVEWKL